MANNIHIAMRRKDIDMRLMTWFIGGPERTARLIRSKQLRSPNGSSQHLSVPYKLRKADSMQFEAVTWSYMFMESSLCLTNEGEDS